ncbi:kinase-like protein [Leucogyrophana mollusca]|uniref:Kinase-like protein n=1 Tax=Leucogyrophana mollusca TaxID=85980 RepID=A0ACB8BFP5_9AGAM|nr:kinase-like protein [Leucogyrophana mollusca]
MTNISAGAKRSWEGSGSHGDPELYSHKRPRDREEPRDWRDVHLRSPGGKRAPPNGRRESTDRRDYVRSRESDSQRNRDYPRERDRRDRERDRDRDRDRDYRRRDDDRKDDRRRRTPSVRDRQSPASTNGRGPSIHNDSDKEEGEISPHRSPSRGSPAPPARDPPVISQPQNIPPEPAPELELDLPDSPPAIEEVLAARRARRQAILAKHAGIASINQSASPSPGPSSAVLPPQSVSSISDPKPQPHSTAATPGVSGISSSRLQNGPSSKRESMSPPPTQDAFELAKGGEEEHVRAKTQAQDENSEQISAADYDPSLDRREDEQRRVRIKDDPMAVDVEIVEEEEEEDVDDMFAVATSEKKKKVKKVAKPLAPALITTTLDTAADPEGYYQVILGEQLDGGRYQVYSSLGKGMFANVVRARVLQAESGEPNKEVAIKIIRSQESMYRAGLKEVQILNKLRQADPEDKKHVVRLERTFEHRGHLCLVFESMSMNLRDVVKRFGKDVGLNIKAVRAYAHQLFLALGLLKKTNIMHADIKPDNILVNEQKTLLKLCDLGSASDASENDITPYLVSRFYRAPEIILGVPYDPALDIWSIGCTLYELYTGKILFPGRSNNQMLLLMMELKGRFNTKMIKKAKFGDVYFDEMGGFESIETDRVTGANVVRKVHFSKPSRDLRARLLPPASVKLKDDESKLLTSFIDLLDKCLALDPARRISPKEALVHPFIRG